MLWSDDGTDAWLAAGSTPTVFGKIGRVRLLPVDAISTVVIDMDAPAADVETLRQRDITVVEA